MHLSLYLFILTAIKARPMTRVVRVFKVVKGHFERYTSRLFVKSVDFAQQKVEEIGEIVRDKHRSSGSQREVEET